MIQTTTRRTLRGSRIDDEQGGPVGWPRLDAAAIAGSVQSLSDDLVEVLVQVIPTLPLAFDRSAPDDFGYVYVVLAEQTLRRMLIGGQSIDALFPAYFASALGAHGRVRDELSALPDQTKLAFSSDILADLCDISGYALVLNDLGLREPWKVVAATWANYLQQQPSATDFLRLLAASLGFLDGLFAVTPRSIVRTGWKRVFEEDLVTKGFGNERDYSMTFNLNSNAGGAIAQAFLAGSLAAPHDVFAVCYLAKQPKFHGIELPRACQNFERALSAATRRRASNVKAEGPVDDE